MRRDLYCKHCGDGIKLRLTGMHFPGESIQWFPGKMRKTGPVTVDLGEEGIFTIPYHLCDLCMLPMTKGIQAMGCVITKADEDDSKFVEELKELIEEDHEAGPAEGS